MPSSRLQMLLRGQNLLGYRHYEDGVVNRFVEKSAENGMDVYRVFDALNDVRNVRQAIAAVRRVDKHAQGTICYTESPLHTVEGYVQMARDLMELGCDSLCIKDMAALLKPQRHHGRDPGQPDEGDRGRRGCRGHLDLLAVARPGTQPDRVAGRDVARHAVPHQSR